MAGLTVDGRNAAVNGLAGVITHLGLLDASGTEVTGGSPAYARIAVTWNAAAAGVRDNVGAALFDVPAVTVAFVGGYSAITAGTNYMIWPVQGASPALPMAATFAASSDTFLSYGHGFSNTNRVVLQDVSSAGLAAGFDENTVYYVVSAATDTLQLSLTSGGAAITSAADMECFIVRCIPETFAAQGQYNIAAGALDLDANLI